MKKPIAVALAVLLVIGGVIAGSMAWLSDETAPVLNVFDTSNVDITLTEKPITDTDGDGKLDSWKPNMIPGVTYDKDPKVGVLDSSEDCYLFVKFEEKNNEKKYLTFTSLLNADKGWIQGNSTNEVPTDVWYRIVRKTDSIKEWELIANNKVTVNSNTVTEETMADASKVELNYTAYAIQLSKDGKVDFTPKEAWENVPKTTA